MRKVARREDIPYIQSPPVQFIYSSTAALSLGSFTWKDPLTAFNPEREILTNALYYFRSITMTADISEFDYTSNVTTPLEFKAYLKGDAKTPLYRQGFRMEKFFDQFDYPFFWRRHTQNDILYGTLQGAVVQGASLIGKTSITVKVIISAQEITHEGFVKDFVTNPYPQ